jgi:bifunctional DNase/RNase
VELAREDGALRISSRPSDAIALAVRYEDPVPIFVEEAVLDEAGVVFEAEEDEEQIEQFREFLEQVSPEDFGA